MSTGLNMVEKAAALHDDADMVDGCRHNERKNQAVYVPSLAGSCDEGAGLRVHISTKAGHATRSRGHAKNHVCGEAPRSEDQVDGKCQWTTLHHQSGFH